MFVYGRFIQHDPRNAKQHALERQKDCVSLFVGETKVDLEGKCQQTSSSHLAGQRMSYAEFGVDEARHALDLVDLVEGFEICFVEGHDFEVLCDPAGCDVLGEGGDAAGD